MQLGIQKAVRTPQNVYRKFIEFEERAADTYLRLASRFAEQKPELSALWLEMAIEEKQHAGLLQFCLAQTLFAPNLPAETDIRKFTGLFRSLERRAADPELDVNGAFVLGSELEDSEVNAIYSYLTTPLHKSLYLLRRKIAVSPANHIDRLVLAAKKFGIPQATIKKLDRVRKSSPTAFF